jgi:hypothetical protein
MNLLYRIVASTPFLLVLFYLVVCPVGWVLRLFGYDPMARHAKPGETTFRTPSVADPMMRMDRD